MDSDWIALCDGLTPDLTCRLGVMIITGMSLSSSID